MLALFNSAKFLEDLNSTNNTLEKIINGELDFDFGEFEKTLAINSMILNTSHFKDGKKIFRAIYVNNKDVLVKQKKRYQYPPIECCKTGRANIDSCPVFYGSTKFTGAVRENILAYGIEELKNNNFVMFLSEWVPKVDFNYFLSFNTNYRLPLGPYLNSNFIAPAFNFNFLLDQIEKIFRYENYKISSKIAHKVMYRERLQLENGSIPPCDFISYPSVPCNSTFTNYAIHPLSLDNKFVLNKIYKIKLNPNINLQVVKENKFVDFKILEVGSLISQDTEIFFDKPSKFEIRLIEHYSST